MADDRVDIKRTRSHSDATSAGSRTGSYRRLKFPEKLVEKKRRVHTLGTADVDDGAAMSPWLANAVTLKACYLETRLKNKQTGEISDPCWGQAGLIRAERLLDSPADDKAKRQALPAAGGADKPDIRASTLRSSRFAVIPTTCVHNLEDEEENGQVWGFENSDLTLVSVSKTFRIDFMKTSYKASQAESILILQEGGKKYCWDYYDVTTAGKIDAREHALTPKTASFEKMERSDYSFQVGQKVGMAVYRNFTVTAEDVGMPIKSVKEELLKSIYGDERQVNIYTGEITGVSPGKEAFQHNINTFRGCSGAVIFLLDLGQDGNGVKEEDHGKAIAIHVGGEQLDSGKIIPQKPFLSFLNVQQFLDCGTVDKGLVTNLPYGYIRAEELLTGKLGDANTVRITKVLEHMKQFAENDANRKSLVVLILNVFDKGFRNVVNARKQGQRCLQPCFARSDAQFTRDQTLHSASVAVVRSGNERAARLCKMSRFLTNRCPGTSWDVDLICDIWPCWSFQTNFMYDRHL